MPRGANCKPHASELIQELYTLIKIIFYTLQPKVLGPDTISKKHIHLTSRATGPTEHLVH